MPKINDDMYWNILFILVRNLHTNIQKIIIGCIKKVKIIFDTEQTDLPHENTMDFYSLDEKMRRRLLRWGVMMSAESVVRKALKAMFHSRRRCLPGVVTKLEAAICAILPSWALLPVMKLPAVRKILDRV